MAYSYYNYTGDGSQTQFPVAFGYIRREHVLATVAGSPATFTWVNSTTIQMDSAPANGALVRVYRVTPLTAPLVDFTDGSTLVAADLDTNARQSIYTQQELDDSLVEGLAGVIPNGDKGDITTSVGGTVWTIDSGAIVEAKIGTGAVTEAKIGTGAVTSAKIANDTIVNADINTSAAIASTKLAFAPTGNIAATTVQAAIEELDTEKAPLASPTFTGTPAAPTATVGVNTTQIATTAFVSTAVNSIQVVPAGAVDYFAMSSAPTGYLKANGAAISRTTYAALFAAIGTTFGAGDGTTFNLPDLRGEFLRTWDDGRGVDSSRSFASAQSFAMQEVTGGITTSADGNAGYFTGSSGAFTISAGGNRIVAAGGASSASYNRFFNFSLAQGGAQTATETRPRNIALLACIKF